MINIFAKKRLVFSAVVIFCAICFLFFLAKKQFAFLKYGLQDSAVLFQPTRSSKDSAASQTIVERIVVSTAQLWRPIQDQIKDTVAQIIVQVSVHDFLQPFKSPAPATSAGSGFFINNTGELVTNFHVVDQAKSIWIQIPSLGKRILDAEIVGVSPDRDIALLRLLPDSLALIEKELGGVPYLSLGDSDLVRRSDEALAVGYPLGQRSVKSTSGVISGREEHFIQTDAPINPGSSGGPLLNSKGEVIGINTAQIANAQNVGYAIPINDLKIILADLHSVKILSKPFLGVIFNTATETLTSSYLKNPLPGGCYVAEIVKGSTLDRAGVQGGDMIYAINGYSVDMFGEMNVPWSEDKISLHDFVSRISIGETLTLTVYRRGVKKIFSVIFDAATVSPIRMMYPGLEEIDYEIFGGFVIMQLTLNHIYMLKERVPGLLRYGELKNQLKSVLVVTHIFPNSQLFRAQALTLAATINEVNGIAVTTLDELRTAIKKSIQTNILTIRASDNVMRFNDNVFVALDWERIIEEEIRLAQDFKYALTPLSKEIIQIRNVQKELSQKKL